MYRDHVEAVATSITNSGGEFVLEGLPVGRYTVAVGARGERGAKDDVATGTIGLTFVVPDSVTVHGTLQGFPPGPTFVAILGADGTMIWDDLVPDPGFTMPCPRGDHWFFAHRGSLVALERITVTPPADPAPRLHARPVRHVSGVVVPTQRDAALDCEFAVLVAGYGKIGITPFAVRPDGGFAIEPPAELPLELSCKGVPGRGRQTIEAAAVDTQARIVLSRD
jgi:hypothetical protein